jgi:hypothetical protein
MYTKLDNARNVAGVILRIRQKTYGTYGAR